MTTLVAWVAAILAVLLIVAYGRQAERIDEVEKENKKLWDELDRQNKLRAVGK
ncbi:MAG: hypothetical protein NWE89_12335 [Candidatus Bathyarchaeota archaeon]|nr:hypothetical protein [Candidatus Bathyarchaeota archaeon]